MSFPVLLFVLASIFSPGPANIAASAYGQRQGYVASLRLLLGMALCFGLAMGLAGLAADAVRKLLPLLSPALRWAGAAYMLWLALSLFLPAKGEGGGGGGAPGFGTGFLLILTNPKLYLFAIGLFASFGDSMGRGLPEVFLAASFLALLQFAAASSWTLMGLGFSLLFRKRAFTLVFRATMALILVFSAYAAVFH